MRSDRRERATFAAGFVVGACWGAVSQCFRLAKLEAPTRAKVLRAGMDTPPDIAPRDWLRFWRKLRKGREATP